MVSALTPGKGFLPGGSQPLTPFSAGSEVYLMVGGISQGCGVLPGGALVSTPFFPAG
ncbi:MAG: hypothetical protein ACK5FE_00470 [Cyanobacteriota bacterium]|jgi:hypothetical protein